MFTESHSLQKITEPTEPPWVITHLYVQRDYRGPKTYHWSSACVIWWDDILGCKLKRAIHNNDGWPVLLFFFLSPKLLCLKHLTQALDKCIILHLSHFPQTGPSDQKAVIMFDMFALRVKYHIYADMWTLLFHGVDEGLHAKASTKQKQPDICEKHQKHVCFHCQTTLHNSHISEILTLKSVLSSLPSPDREPLQSAGKF